MYIIMIIIILQLRIIPYKFLIILKLNNKKKIYIQSINFNTTLHTYFIVLIKYILILDR